MRRRNTTTGEKILRYVQDLKTLEESQELVDLATKGSVFQGI